MLKTAIAIRHIHFEDLGTFEAVLSSAGYKLYYHDVGVTEFSTFDPLEPDLLIALGGPIGICEVDTYPLLGEVRDLVRARLEAARPLLGICLGAQQIAAALGAKVSPMSAKEIGFRPVTLNEAGLRSPLRHMDGAQVLHWHGDAFEIPDGALNLASTPACATQAFSLGPNVLGIQFHPEADACSGLERWLIGHASELNSAGIDPRIIRKDAERYGPALREAARTMLAEWLAGLCHSTRTVDPVAARQGQALWPDSPQP